MSIFDDMRDWPDGQHPSREQWEEIGREVAAMQNPIMVPKPDFVLIHYGTTDSGRASVHRLTRRERIVERVRRLLRR